MKQAFVDRVNREMAADFPTADLPPREALAQACRILAREGHESGLAGQVTARADGSSWWTLPTTLTQSLVYLGLSIWAARKMGLSNQVQPGALNVLERSEPRV